MPARKKTYGALPVKQVKQKTVKHPDYDERLKAIEKLVLQLGDTISKLTSSNPPSKPSKTADKVIKDPRDGFLECNCKIDIDRIIVDVRESKVLESLEIVFKKRFGPGYEGLVISKSRGNESRVNAHSPSKLSCDEYTRVLGNPFLSKKDFSRAIDIYNRTFGYMDRIFIKNEKRNKSR